MRRANARRTGAQLSPERSGRQRMAQSGSASQPTPHQQVNSDAGARIAQSQPISSRGNGRAHGTSMGRGRGMTNHAQVGTTSVPTYQFRPPRSNDSEQTGTSRIMRSKRTSCLEGMATRLGAGD